MRFVVLLLAATLVGCEGIVIDCKAEKATGGWRDEPNQLAQAYQRMCEKKEAR